MATTVEILSYTKDRYPVYSPIPIVLGPSSGTVDECKFKYVLEVQVSTDMYTGNGSPTWTTVGTLKQIPDPQGLATFDVSRILQNYVEHISFPDITGAIKTINTTENRGDYVWCKVRAGCEYSTVCTDTPDQYYNQDNTTLLAWNAGLQYDFPLEVYDASVVFEMRDTLVTAPYLNRFLINAPSAGIPIGENGVFALKAHNFGNSILHDIYFEWFGLGGAGGLGNLSIAAVGTLSQVGEDIINIGVGPYNLRSVSPMGLAGLSNMTHYFAWIGDDDGDRISEKIRFNIDRGCATDNTVTLTWLNRWGGMDTFAFTKNNIRSVPIKKNLYERVFGKFLGGPGFPGDFSHSLSNSHGGDRGRTSLFVDARDKYKLTTDFVSEDVAIWLEELFTSPAVYMLDGSHWYNVLGNSVAQLPMVVTSTTYEEKDMSNKKLISYTIEIESAYDKVIQKG